MMMKKLQINNSSNRNPCFFIQKRSKIAPPATNNKVINANE